MSETLPPLVLPIVGDTTGIQTALTKTQQMAAQFGGKIGAAFNGVQGTLTKLGESFKGLLGPIVAAAAAYATFHAAMEALNRADELGKAAASLGITVEKLQELQATARLTGGSAEGMNMALREMGRNIAQANAGEESAIESFAKLGLQMRDIQGLKPDEAFLKIADAMANMSNAQDRLQVSQEIFGRGSRDLAETLTLGRKEIEATAAEAKKLGLVLNASQIGSLKEMNDTIEAMKLQFEVIVAKVMTNFSDLVSVIADEFGRTAKNVNGVSDGLSGLGDFLSLIAVGVIDIGKLFVAGGMIIGGILSNIANAILQLVGVFYNAGSNITAMFVGVGDMAMSTWDLIVGYATKAFLKMKEGLASVLSGLFKAVGESISTLGDALGDMPGGESLRDLGQAASELGKNISGDVVDEMKKADDDINKALDSIGTGFDEMVDKSRDLNDDTGLPEWLAESLKFTDELGSEYGATLDGMESSTVNLLKKWTSVKTEVDMVHSKMGTTTVSILDSVKATQALTAEYAKFLEKVSAYSEKGKKAAQGDDPIKALQAEHDAMLAELDRFHESDIGKTVKYNEEKLKIDTAYNEQRAKLVGDQHAAIQTEIDSFNQTDWGTRLAHLESIAAMEEENYAAQLEVAAARQEDDLGHATEEEEAAQVHANNMIAIEEQRSQVETQINQARAATIAGILGQAAALMDKNNKAQFTAWKVFASGQAIINALLSFSTIMGDPKNELMFGPAGQIALATTSLGLGMAAAAKIASTPYGGSGGSASLGGSAGGGGGSAASSARSQSEASSSTNMNVTLYGDNFSGSSVRGLIGAINEAAGDNANIKMQVNS
jgi:hypothetical protein